MAYEACLHVCVCALPCACQAVLLRAAESGLPLERQQAEIAVEIALQAEQEAAEQERQAPQDAQAAAAARRARGALGLAEAKRERGDLRLVQVWRGS